MFINYHPLSLSFKYAQTIGRLWVRYEPQHDAANFITHARVATCVKQQVVVIVLSLVGVCASPTTYTYNNSLNGLGFKGISD